MTHPLSIRTKLIVLFIGIKVIPLIALAWFAWQGGQILAEKVLEATGEMTTDMRNTVQLVGESMTGDAIKALDVTSREAMERLTTDTAAKVAAFLYDRDGDIRLAASLPPSEKTYHDFLSGLQQTVTDHEPWVLNPDGTAWIPSVKPADQPTVESSAKDNERDFHYRPPETSGIRIRKPLYAEMTFIGLDGHEQVKVTTAAMMPPAKRDVSKRENTFIKAETYFPELKTLKPGQIYVSEVIGAYVRTHLIGAYTQASAEKKGIPFKPEDSAYAGMENPVGKRYQGIVRWATPVVQGGKVTGWVTLALDHIHLRELVDHIVPTAERFSPISDAGTGNYAFIWDDKGRSIVHPRHYFMTGYDPETGEPTPPWLEDTLYADWKAGGLPIRQFMDQAPTFRDQSLKRKPSTESIKRGEVGLDCRFLNFAPQCVGWMDLTRHGGSGSFAIFWSGLWKLTTAATIPYYTGRYAATPRGFGFVTVGANIDDFHRAATKAKDRIDGLMRAREDELTAKRASVTSMIGRQLAALARNLSVSTFFMSLLVIGVAVWMASLLTHRVTALVAGIRRFQQGDLDYRLAISTHDEMGELAISLNQMADAVADSVRRLDEDRRRAEEVSRLKSEFLANVSHELRTPLNGILGFADLLREDGQTDEDREHAQIIFENGQHLLEVVNQLLDIAKVEAGKLELNRIPVDIRGLVSAVAPAHERVAIEKGLQFTLDVSPDLPDDIIGDPMRIKQVLHNLLNNAVKFTETGSVGLTLSADPSGVCFAVSDTGPGIPDDAREAIFEKFSQLESFSTRAHSGTGLGLALALHLARLMGGNITVDSVAGQGSTFHFTLPATAGEAG